MAKFGYFLSSEEHGPKELVRQAKLAEQAGFEGLWISDHFHPWLDEQGQSPFVWSVIGAIAEATSLPITTAVTCPLVRIHPVIIAQAAATSAVLTGGRFRLGVGTGEALNEHVVDSRWPPAEERLEMLEEAVEIMRELWSGKLVTHRGEHYDVDTARIYTLPDEPPPIYMSGFGDKSVELAGRIADGYITTGPSSEMVGRFRTSGGAGKTVQGGLKVCYAEDEGTARKTVHRLWPTQGVQGEAAQLLPLPRHFEQLAQMVTEEEASKGSPCGPDPEVHVKAIKQYLDAGFDEVYISQIGEEQDAFFDFYAREVLPRLR
ncbi:LLM class F420-dependent oxidoreductase [Planomonospora sp. ID67723]|uniref:LLM class F420-dependent oxidoreductase n=1 Tax=Planomonospora sp. ID67723 TaxID=2738134 RepID=UPI0018C43331|nr:LLM class F420-dependent oxidoreductase [Planomonospora sp. ID67723]MBG0829988.1 LLM class F420-dependent oxidoreductase [Planomonospora sp. ID67723]